MPRSVLKQIFCRTSPSTYVMDVEAAILRSMPGHQFLLLPFGLQSVAKVVQAFHSHTGRSLQHNTTCIAAFLVGDTLCSSPNERMLCDWYWAPPCYCRHQPM